MITGSFWPALAAIVVLAIVYEYNPVWGGVLLLVAVFGMLLVAQRNGHITF